MNLDEDKVLCFEHDKRFRSISYLIYFQSVILAIAVFIYGIALIAYENSMGFFVIIFGMIAVFINHAWMMFLLSVAYDIKIIRNKKYNTSNQDLAKESATLNIYNEQANYSDGIIPSINQEDKKSDNRVD